MDNKTLKEQLEEIELFIQYAAPEEERITALEMVEKYAEDQIAMRVFHSFYSYLPEAEDDAITSIKLLGHKQGVFLLNIVTLLANYLYLATNEEAIFLDDGKEGIWDEEILDFFGWQNRENFLKYYDELANLPEYMPASERNDLCPVCSTARGEHHILGCPIEVCPWCGGQLIHCNCRFTKLNRQKLERDSHLDELFDTLVKKGRIPFNPDDQLPLYPSAIDLSEKLKKTNY